MSGARRDGYGRYVRLRRNELFVGAGLFQMDRRTLARRREIVAEETTRQELEWIFVDAEPLVAWLRQHLAGYADPCGLPRFERSIVRPAVDVIPRGGVQAPN